MKKLLYLLTVGILVVMTMPGCSSTPKARSLPQPELPDLIPLRNLFLNVETQFNYKVSPDGKKVAWIAVKDRRLTIIFRVIGKDEIGIINTHSPRSIRSFVWAQDSRRILYAQDQEGNENTHIYLANTDYPEQRPVNLTPYADTRASVHWTIRSDPDHVLISHNRRDKTVFDLYRVNLETLAQTEIAHNPGDVSSWITDLKGNLRGRIRESLNERRLELWDAVDQKWTNILTWGFEERVDFLGFTPDDKSMWLTSNRGRDRIGLIRLDLKTGEETLVFEHRRVDLDRAVVSELSQKPLFASSHPDYPEIQFFDPGLETDFAILRKQGPAGFRLISSDNQERMLTVQVYTDKGSEYYLLNRNLGERVLLSRSHITNYATSLSKVQPISFTSRDGLRLHGYLTLPKGSSGRGLPMVLLVHGGPWARDYWGCDGFVQFLANRGYSVLQINYRGSSGYGRKFMEAAVGEFAGKMHDDLIDGVKWAIKRGIANPKKICIAGGSYGGYAALVGLTFTPDIFACGIDVVGPSNLVSFLETVPPYWKLFMPLWYKYVGDPKRPEDRSVMEAKSPLFRADRLKGPVLIIHGANDARVNQIESDQMVEALRKENGEVEYLLLPDEGHKRTFGNWKNTLKYHRTIEDFLSKHLGGRSAALDYYESGL